MLPTNTQVDISVSTTIAPRAGAIAIFITQDAGEIDAPALSDADRRAAERLLSAGVVSGKSKELAFDLVEVASGKAASHRRIFVVGLGPSDKATAQTLRHASARLARALRKHELNDVAVVLPAVESIAPTVAAEAIVTGACLARFRYTEYKGAASKKADAKNDDASPLKLTIVASDIAAVRASADRAKAIADGQNFARTIASRPGNNINPPTLAKVAGDLAKEVGLAIRVLDEKQMLKLGMGGILAVGAGSASPPRMIALEWKGMNGRGKGQGARGKEHKRNSSPSPLAARPSPLLIVGKSITFDTGGISIKPADKMGEMIFDKCGGMAVLGLMYAVAKLKLPINVVGILTSAENMPGSRAYRPGDILRMYNGVTVEVTNTDAEGRLVLADALAWGIETYKPSAVIDLATLTGGVVTALGTTMAGVMANNDDLVAELQTAADASGEKIWRLPIGDDQRDQIKSDPADIVNSAGRWASPLQGGAFLSHFVPRDDSVPWAHLDIAGVADTEKELPLYARGATGWGVRTLVEWVSGRINATNHATPRPAGG